MNKIDKFLEASKDPLIFTKPSVITGMLVVGMAMPKGTHCTLEFINKEADNGKKSVKLEIDREVPISNSLVLKVKNELTLWEKFRSLFGKKYYKEVENLPSLSLGIKEIIAKAEEYFAGNINDYKLLGLELANGEFVFYAAFKKRPGLSYRKLSFIEFQNFRRALKFKCPKVVFKRNAHSRGNIIKTCEKLFSTKKFQGKDLEPFNSILIQSGLENSEYVSEYRID